MMKPYGLKSAPAHVRPSRPNQRVCPYYHGHIQNQFISKKRERRANRVYRYR